MEKIVTALQGRKRSENRLTRNSKLFKTIIEAIQEKKGSEIISLDLRKIDEAVADFFILCEGQSHVQIKAIAENIEEKVWKVCNDKPYHIELGDQWTLVDYVNVVIHIFQPDQRHFYNLESLWEDAGRVEHNG